jgi:hypothetical protein
MRLSSFFDDGSEWLVVIFDDSVGAISWLLKTSHLFYADPNAPRLMRKWRIWNACLERGSIAKSN